MIKGPKGPFLVPSVPFAVPFQKIGGTAKTCMDSASPAISAP
jgi:hypothetical protein